MDLKTGIDFEKPYLSKKSPYDLVYSNYVQHFLINKENIILSAYNNLKPGGWFFFHDIEYSHLTTKQYLTRKEMEKIIEKCGFKIIKSQQFDYFDKKTDHMHWHVIVEIRAQKNVDKND